MCRADLTERAAEEKDMLVLAKEEENIVVNKPALSQIRSICELSNTRIVIITIVEKYRETKGNRIGTCGRKEKKLLDRIHRSC